MTGPLQRQRPQDRLASGGSVQRKPAPSAARIARRRFMVGATKWILPLVALLLLGSIAAWPEIVRISDHGRVAFRRAMQLEAESGQMVNPRYHGVDQRGRPYTVTAASANQTSPERVALVDPKGDLTTESGTWIMVQAKDGVFIQHQSLLDLSRDVFLYREDGTTLQTDTAAMDMRAGAGTSRPDPCRGAVRHAGRAGLRTLVDKGSCYSIRGASRTPDPQCRESQPGACRGGCKVDASPRVAGCCGPGAGPVGAEPGPGHRHDQGRAGRGHVPTTAWNGARTSMVIIAQGRCAKAVRGTVTVTADDADRPLPQEG